MAGEITREELDVPYNPPSYSDRVQESLRLAQEQARRRASLPPLISTPNLPDAGYRPTLPGTGVPLVVARRLAAERLRAEEAARRGPAPQPAATSGRVLLPSDLPPLPPEAMGAPPPMPTEQELPGGLPPVPPGVRSAGGSRAAAPARQTAGQPTPERTGSGSPVVTGNAASATQTPGGNLLDMLRARLGQEVNQDGSDNVDRQLVDFGAGLASGTSRNFGQNFGAGLAALQAGRAARTNQVRQGAELETTAQFRQAQIEVQRAEQALAADPTSPRNQLSLAQARYYLAQAADLANNPRGSGGSGRPAPTGTGILIVNAEGQQRVHYPRIDGQDIPAGWRIAADVRRDGTAERGDLRTRLTAAQARVRLLADDPRTAFGPEIQAARREAEVAARALEAPRAATPAPAVGPAAAPAPASAAPEPRRIPLLQP